MLVMTVNFMRPKIVIISLTDFHTFIITLNNYIALDNQRNELVKARPSSMIILLSHDGESDK